MKRISLVLTALALCCGPNLRAQDAATEERLNKLTGQIDDLRAGQESLRKQIDSLMREISNLRDQASKPTATYASPDDLKRVADAVKEVDRKRLEDYDKIRTELVSLRKQLLAPLPPTHKTIANGSTTSNTSSIDDKPAKPEKGFEYEVQSGDTLSTIVQAYREKNIKVSTDQILKANPGLKPEKLRVGQKLWIPAPSQT
jgi:LysM repeat protein